LPRFSIVIVSYQSADWIGACLDGLDRQTFRDFEIILVDNASKDPSLEIAGARELDNLRIIRNDTNLGFAAGCNRGAGAARGQWVIFLNPDTVARSDWLEQIADGQTRYPSVSVFASAQYELGRTDRLDGAGDAYFGFGIPWRGGFGHLANTLPQEGECFSPCGAAFVVRRSLFEASGRFDERFFCYCEDVDLGFRLRLMGERCVFLNKAAVDHKGSAISGRYSDFTVYHGTRNRMWTYIKNMPLGLLALTLPGHIVLTLYLLARSLSVGRFGPTWRGLKDGVKGLPTIWKSRGNQVQTGKRVQIARAMSWNLNAMRNHRSQVREFESRA